MVTVGGTRLEMIIIPSTRTVLLLSEVNFLLFKKESDNNHSDKKSAEYSWAIYAQSHQEHKHRGRQPGCEYKIDK
jgi:hypothetical protein